MISRDNLLAQKHRMFQKLSDDTTELVGIEYWVYRDFKPEANDGDWRVVLILPERLADSYDAAIEYYLNSLRVNGDVYKTSPS